MNDRIVANDLLILARELIGMEFDTKEEMDEYKREHDVRPGTKMEVKPKSDPAAKHVYKVFPSNYKEEGNDNARQKLLKHLTEHPEITPKTHRIERYDSDGGGYTLTHKDITWNESKNGKPSVSKNPDKKYRPNSGDRKIWNEIGRGSEKHTKKVTGELLVLAKELLGIGV